MIIVAGGQLDPNIGRLLRRLLHRGLDFRDLLIGPNLHPRITWDIHQGQFFLNDELVEPSAGFVRHDVFLQQKEPSQEGPAAALNWFYAVRGWLVSRDSIRCFNRRSEGVENNKLRNLEMARAVGLMIPPTVVTNDFSTVGARFDQAELIQKPVAGGELTTLFESFRKRIVVEKPIAHYPRFVQERLIRPELRVYRIGDKIFGFYLSSDELDYRRNNRVLIKPGSVPQDIQHKFVSLCDKLGLDFAAGDFMRAERSGAYCFLEVNSQPMFAAFDIAVDGTICDAIVDYLCL